MKVLKEYKTIFLSGLAVMFFFAAAYFVVGNAEQKSKYTYAEHIFQEGVVNEIDIRIDEDDWQDMLENPLEEEYHRANVTINGEVVGNVAIRTKGNTSLTSVANSDSDRYSFKLDFDYYDNNGNYYGLRKLCLNNNYADNSSMREYIAYKIMSEMGLPVPACGYSHITVNGEEWGLYLAVEPVDEVFLATRFENAEGDLYKPEGMGGTGADLVYRGDEISEYTGLNLKTNLETSDGSEIIALIQALESGEGLEEVLDIENALKYIAANVALANYDSYLGGTTHNYYLYEENEIFSVIPWDMNLAFGGFSGGEIDIYSPADNSMGGGRGGDRAEKSAEERQQPVGNKMFEAETENTPNFDIEKFPMGDMVDFGGMPQMPRGMPSFGNNEGKPLVDALLADETLRSLYEGYLQEIVDTYLTEEYMTALVTQVHDLIAPYVEQDATAFYTYEEFEQACSIDPTDEYSLVYYAVNMAESIQTQLAGGEPTFDVSNLKGGGMEMGRKGAQQDFAVGMSDMESMLDSGGEESVNEESSAVEELQADPTFENNKGMKKGGERPANMGVPGNVSGEKGRQQVDISEVLPVMVVCCGIFITGSIILVLFNRKRNLK